MRAVNLFGMLIMGVGLVVIGPTISTGQPGGKKGGNPRGGGGTDPNAIFDNYAQGRNYFLISQTRNLNGPLTQFAQEKGIRNGQITRQQFLEFYDWRAKQAAASGGNPFGGKGGNPFGGKKSFGMDLQPPGGAPGGPPSAEAIAQAAKLEFDSLDRNKDGVLNQEEMPGFLRKDLAKWDKNSDGVIDFNEYKDYYTAKITARLQGDADGSGRNGPAAIIIDDNELDLKPVVFRAGGKMPAGLPPWFKELDTDNDGQVALYEWRKAGKSMDEFANWDLNGDGFITPEEALKQQLALGKSDKGSLGNSLASPGGEGDSGGKGKGGGFMKGFGKDGGKGGFQWPRPSISDSGNPDSGSATDGGGKGGKGGRKKGGGGGGN